MVRRANPCCLLDQLCSAAVEAAAESSPQNTSTAVPTSSASASSLSVPVSRAIRALCCEQKVRALVVPQFQGDSATQPRPAQPFLGRDLVAREFSQRVLAQWGAGAVVVGERDQCVQQQAGDRALAV